MSKTIEYFKIISKTLDTFPLEEKCIHNTALVDKETPAFCIAKNGDKTNGTADFPDTEHSQIDDKSDKKGERKIAEYPVKTMILSHIRTGDMMKIIIRWYGYRPDPDT